MQVDKEIKENKVQKQDPEKKKKMEDEILLTGQTKSQNTISQLTVNRQNPQLNTSQQPKTQSLTPAQIQQQNKTQLFAIVICMVAMIGILAFTNFYKSLVSSVIIGLNLGQLQKHSNLTGAQGFPDLFKILAYENQVIDIKDPIYNLCPVSIGVFHTYYNKTDSEMEYVKQEYQNRANQCNVSIVGIKELKQLKKKWNTKFPQTLINLTLINDPKTKQMLLILLQLYFNAGTYINIEIPYSQIDDRCWKYALTGYGALYGDFTEEKEGIYVPDIWKFMKVRFPYSLEIEQMIERLVGGGDVLEECKKEQCLVIKCYDN